MFFFRQKCPEGLQKSSEQILGIYLSEGFLPINDQTEAHCLNFFSLLCLCTFLLFKVLFPQCEPSSSRTAERLWKPVCAFWRRSCPQAFHRAEGALFPANTVNNGFFAALWITQYIVPFRFWDIFLNLLFFC